MIFNKINKKTFFFIIFFLVFPISAFSFPDQEKLGTSSANPPYNFGFSDTVTGFVLVDDNTMLVSYGDNLKIVDLTLYSLASTQPVELSDDEGTDGRIADIAYSDTLNRVYASQEDGDCLIFDLDDLSEDPTSVQIADGKTLGSIVLDNNSRAYIANNTDEAIHVMSLSGLNVIATIDLSLFLESGLEITDATYVTATDELYFTTDKGVVFYMAAGGSTATLITIDSTHVDSLSSVSPSSDGTYILVTNQTEHELLKISTSTHQLTSTIDLTPNTTPISVVATQVSNPQNGTGNANYAYVAGSGGVSVVNTTAGIVLDMGTDEDINYEPISVSVVPRLLLASSVTDGYVYMINTSQNLGILTANPWIIISSLTYSGGGSQMGTDENFTITFQADEAGTATIRAGGDITGSGSLLTDTSGATSWAVATADTDVSVTISYTDNATLFDEGSNEIFIFVEDADGNIGRIATTITVDTPPPSVEILSTGFGYQRVYVTFNRLTASDISYYNIYVDTSADAVLTKTEIGAKISQVSSGDTQEGVVTGLDNSYLYYIAMEAVDANANVSLVRTNTFLDGSLAYEVPQETVGPVGLAGQGSCHMFLNTEKECNKFVICFLMFPFALLVFRKLLLSLCQAGAGSPLAEKRGTIHLITGFLIKTFGNDKKFKGLMFLGIFLALILISQNSYANVTKSSQWFSMEVKTGFWVPQDSVVKGFFGTCCNVVTKVQGGLLLKKKYGIEGGLGIFYKKGEAIGRFTRRTSRDEFSFLMLPFETNFAWRMHYWKWDYVVPFFKVGADYLFFREAIREVVTKNIKLGGHVSGGIQINLKIIGTDSIHTMDEDYGVNDMYIILEAQHQFIDNFGSSGLDLSGQLYSIGLLFEF